MSTAPGRVSKSISGVEPDAVERSQPHSQILSTKTIPGVTAVRRHQRIPLRMKCTLRLSDTPIEAETSDLSTAGLQIVSPETIAAGTPLELNCCLGQVGHLAVCGQTVFSTPASHDGLTSYLIGVQFAGLREWERRVLASAIEELFENPHSMRESFLTISAAKDSLALEATNFYVRHPDSDNRRYPTVQPSCIHAATIVGWGSYLPPNEVTNEHINQWLDLMGKRTRFGKVVGTLTGIKSRRYAGSRRYPSDLAVEASRQALRDARMDPMDLDVVISCGVARDVEEPATAYIIQEKLGAKNAYAFDIANACNGFISAIDVLDSLIASSRCNNGLVAVGDVLSQYVTWNAGSKKDLHMSSMGYTFGDGGGAAVLQRAPQHEKPGIRARWFLSDSSYWKVAVIPLMDSPRRLFKSHAAEIERAALKHVPVGVQEVMRALDWDIDDIDLIIPHQVASHIIENLFFKILKMPHQKVYWSFPRHGNVGAASMPVALCEAYREGRLKHGDKVLLVGGSGGFGAGVLGLVF